MKRLYDKIMMSLWIKNLLPKSDKQAYAEG